MLKYKPKEYQPSEAFDQFLKEKLITARYDALHLTLCLSDNWWGRYRNNPAEIKLGVLLILAEELDISPDYLMEEYGVGANAISSGEYQAIKLMQTQTT